MTKPIDLQEFMEGQTVNIDGVADMQGVVIKRIAYAGVTIDGPNCGEMIISCKSPAVLADSQRKVEIEYDEETQRQTVTILRSAGEDGESHAGRRGKHTDVMNNLKFPTVDFTAAMLAEMNEIPYQYAANYCRENCEAIGHAPKPAGQRGKPATLYKKVA